jgi:hypothetical protein
MKLRILRAAAKLCFCDIQDEEHTSVAKASIHFCPFHTGDKSPAYRPNESFRGV